MKLSIHLVCVRNGELSNKEFFQHINSHCRRTSKVASRKNLEKSQLHLLELNEITNSVFTFFGTVQITWFSNLFLLRLQKGKGLQKNENYLTYFINFVCKI